MGVQCPSCKENLAVKSIIPDSQLFYFVLDFDGEWLCASTLGGTITEMSKLLKAVAKDSGVKVEVFIESVEYGDHKAKVGMLIARQSTNGQAITEPVDTEAAGRPSPKMRQAEAEGIR